MDYNTKTTLDFSPTIIEIFWAKAPLSTLIPPRAEALGNKLNNNRRANPFLFLNQFPITIYFLKFQNKL